MSTPKQRGEGKMLLSLEQIKAALADRRISAVAAATGLHANTLHQIKKGRQTNPSLRTITILSDYLIRQTQPIL
jgi:transcriptional regulator with XRE-family HTH domain